jgi:hypothetical protein
MIYLPNETNCLFARTRPVLAKANFTSAFPRKAFE